MFDSKKLLKHLLLLFFLYLSACNSETHTSPSLESSSGTGLEKPQFLEKDKAQGVIANQNWQFVQGKAILHKNRKQAFLEIVLWDRFFDNPCLEKRGSALQVRLTVLNEENIWTVGDDPFVLYPVIAFSDLLFQPRPLAQLIANQGTIHIWSIYQNQVMGYFEGFFDDTLSIGKTEVKGAFQVTLCPASF